MKELYESGDVPWDSEEPPPEVIQYLDTVATGKALDLGCGYGRAAIYMAKLGWEVDAIDFVPEALQEASARATRQNVEVNFHRSQVTDLDYLEGPYDFALDVGCGHNLDSVGFQKYHNELKRLIRQNGVFMLFSRIQEDAGAKSEDGPSGIEVDSILSLFKDGFYLESKEFGQTEGRDDTFWKSGWFVFRRK